MGGGVIVFRKYLEKEIFRKVTIINLLWEKSSLTSLEMSQQLNVSVSTIKGDIKAINLQFDETDPLIESNPTGYLIRNKYKRNKRTYMKKVYQYSPFIKACMYFFKTDFSNPLGFAKQEFISSSKAYQLKKEVMSYVASYGIDLNDKKVEDEYRLRFLIALFQMKSGIQVVKVSKTSQYKINHLFQQIEKEQKCLFSDFSKEYAQILLQLMFDRKMKLKDNLDIKKLEMYKCTPIYHQIEDRLVDFLKQMFLSPDERNLNYCTIVFNFLNQNFYEINAHEKNYQCYIAFTKEFPVIQYEYLIDKMERNIPNFSNNQRTIEVLTLMFLRKCHFNFQQLIPEEHVVEGTDMAEIPQAFFEKIKRIFMDWNDFSGLNLAFSDDHFRYLATKIYFLTYRSKNEKRVFLLTGVCTDFLWAQEMLEQEFGNTLDIQQFNPETIPSNYNKRDVILYNISHEKLSQIDCFKMRVSFNFDFCELFNIRKELFGYDIAMYKKIIEKELR